MVINFSFVFMIHDITLFAPPPPVTGFITSLHSIVIPLKVRMPPYLYHQIFWSTFKPKAILGLGYSSTLGSSPLNSKERMLKNFKFSQVLWRIQQVKNLLEIRYQGRTDSLRRWHWSWNRKGENDLTICRGHKENSYFFPSIYHIHK